MSKTYKRRMKVAPTSWIGILKVIHDFPSNKCELIIITQYTNEGRLKHIHVIPLLIWFYTSTKKCQYTFKSIGPINFSFSHACTSNPFGGHTFAIFNLDSSIAPNIILFCVDLPCNPRKKKNYWAYEHDLFRCYSCTMERCLNIAIW